MPAPSRPARGPAASASRPPAAGGGPRSSLRPFPTSPLKERIKQVAIPDPKDLSDEALMKHCRRFVKTNYHPAGTCRMGTASDSMAVLDSRLRVRGVDNLRICDLSAMPNIN